MTNVFIIDDHPLILSSVETILNSDEEINVVGKSIGFDNNTTELIKGSSCDVLILDVSMPEMDAFEITPIIRKELPDVKIIIYTMHSIYRYFKYFYNQKIEGYIVKSSRTADLIDGIKKVAEGGFYYPDHILKQIQLSNQQMELNQVQFTKFEKRLLENLSKQMTNKEIAQVMNCSLQEVLFSRKKLLLKTNTTNTENMLKLVFS